MTRVGFIGLGSQGGPMAQQIVDAGYATTLWARRPETLEQYEGTSAIFAASPAEVGSASDVLCVCVVDDAGVDEILRGDAAEKVADDAARGRTASLAHDRCGGFDQALVEVHPFEAHPGRPS